MKKLILMLLFIIATTITHAQYASCGEWKQVEGATQECRTCAVCAPTCQEYTECRTPGGGGIQVNYQPTALLSSSTNLDANCGPVFFEVRGGDLYSCQYCFEEPGFVYKKCNPLGPVVGDGVQIKLTE